MTAEQALVTLLRALRDSAIGYALTGSLASNLHGIPRSTKDANVLLNGNDSSIGDLAGRLGDGFRLDPQAPLPGAANADRHVIQVQGSFFVIAFQRLRDDPHDRAMFHRKQRSCLLDLDAWTITAEDVIIAKLRRASGGRRFKHLDDSRNVIAVQGNNLDWPYLRSWCERHGSLKLLDELLARLPQM